MSSAKVTVYGRVKPCPKNLKSQELRIQFGESEDFITFLSTKNPNKKSYRFKKVFDADAPQQQVFEIVAKPVIKKVLAGYNGTIFTYGQTGSGKTYTMTGDLEKFINPGLIPRVIQEIFEQKEKSMTVSISYCEIYNEHVYDLVRIDRNSSDFVQVNLMDDTTGITHFRNLSVHIVSSAFEALELLSRGDANKMIAETASNSKSSRSHVIFSISLDLPHPERENLRLKPVFYLVDLAGSEKLSKTKTPTTNPWETRYINLSLHYLEQVLVALNTPGRAHIPYRNSLMTALLRNSLGGNCYTSMIATFSFMVEDLEETIQTFRFAERIAMIKNEVKLTEIIDPDKEIEILRKQNEQLKAQLKVLEVSVPKELNEQDREECNKMVENYIESNDSTKLPLADIKRTEYCFWLMKEKIKKCRIDNKRHEYHGSNDFDISNFCTPQQINTLQKLSSKTLPLKSGVESEKNLRRKRTPVDLPKVNITYKKWKSTTHITEDVTEKTENTDETEKQDSNHSINESSKALEKKDSKKITATSGTQSKPDIRILLSYSPRKGNSISSKFNTDNTASVDTKNNKEEGCAETKTLSSSTATTDIQEKVGDVSDISTSKHSLDAKSNMEEGCAEIKPLAPTPATTDIQERVGDVSDVSINKHSLKSKNKKEDKHSSKKHSPCTTATTIEIEDKGAICRVKKIQNEYSAGEMYSFEEVKKNANAGVHIDITQEEVPNEEISTGNKYLDELSVISEANSQFSTTCLPLTGDPEVDEEIIKFYKARYKVFKTE